MIDPILESHLLSEDEKRINKALEFDASEIIERDTENRIFARMCQILSKFNYKIGVSFTTLNKLESKDYDYKDIPEFFSEDTRRRIKFLNMIEDATNQEITSVKSLLTGDINSDLCKNKMIDIQDDFKNMRIIVKLLETRSAELEY